MSDLRLKWVGRWSAEERQFRFFRVMWERTPQLAGTPRRCSYKLAVSLKNCLPRITLRKSFGGIYV